MKAIKVKGIDAKGNKRSINYVVPLFASNSFEEIRKVMQYAEDEYTCDYVWNEGLHAYKPEGYPYREFAEITSVEFIED